MLIFMAMFILGIIAIMMVIPLLFFCFGVWVFTNSIHAYVAISSTIGKVLMILGSVLGVIIMIAAVEGLIAAAALVGLYYLYKLWQEEKKVQWI